MKEIVINTTFGGFYMPAGFDEYGVERDDPALVKWVKDHTNSDGVCRVSSVTELSIALVPDNATDWCVNDYDGYESVTFVLDGKMNEAKLWEPSEEPEHLLPMFCVNLTLTNWVRAHDQHEAISMTIANLEDEAFEVEEIKPRAV